MKFIEIAIRVNSHFKMEFLNTGFTVAPEPGESVLEKVLALFEQKDFYCKIGKHW